MRMPWEETAGRQPSVEPHHGPVKVRIVRADKRSNTWRRK
jgi:hypothetical protein